MKQLASLENLGGLKNDAVLGSWGECIFMRNRLERQIFLWGYTSGKKEGKGQGGGREGREGTGEGREKTGREQGKGRARGKGCVIALGGMDAHAQALYLTEHLTCLVGL
jgi:hypothetical protein